MEILLVEDNEPIAKGLAYTFEKNGYAFSYVTTVREAEKYLDGHAPADLVILDISLPDGNGMKLYRDDIKPRGIPVIFLTARDDEDDIVKGLELGAEDYITKPFGTKELLARVNKVFLRLGKQRVVRVRDITYDASRPSVARNGVNIELTALEMRIVGLLFSSLNKTVSRDTMLDRICDWTGNFVDDHTVTVYLGRIREKLGKDVITTVKGIGYRIDEE